MLNYVDANAVDLPSNKYSMESFVYDGLVCQEYMFLSSLSYHMPFQFYFSLIHKNTLHPPIIMGNATIR